MKYTAFSALAVLLLAGCGSQVTAPTGTSTTASTTPTAEAPAPTVEPFVIGAIAPLTGDAAVYGVVTQNAFNFGIAEDNAEEDRFRVIWEDGKCNPKDASAAAQKLLNVDKVDIVLASCSGEVLAVAPLTEKARVPLITSLATNPDISEAGEYIYRVSPSDSGQGMLLAQIATEQGWQKVGIITEQTDYAVGVEKVFEESFGGEVVSEEFLSTESDFKTRVTKLKASDVDGVIINPQTGSKMTLILKAFQEQQWDRPLLLNELHADPSVATDYGTYLMDLPFVRATGFRAPAKSPILAHFVQSYTDTYGEAPEFLMYAATAYDLAKILGHTVHSTTRDVTGAISGVNGFEGIYGEVTFDEKGDASITHQVFVFNGTDFVPAE